MTHSQNPTARDRPDGRRIAWQDAEGRCYWALLATPQVYDLEAAVEASGTDLWTTDGQPIEPGDRCVVWKAKGRGGGPLRGVVALAEVLDRPSVRPDASPYWVDPGRGAVPAERVRVRYVVPPGLPVWLGGDPERDRVLRDLSVSRGQGRSVFHVTPRQWAAVLDLVGGWPERDPGNDRLAAEERAGYAVDPAAMAVAVASVRGFYASLGYVVETMGEQDPFSLRCLGADGAERLVVVRLGDVGDAERVSLPPEVVQAAASASCPVAVYVVAADGSGRLLHAADPWQPGT